MIKTKEKVEKDHESNVRKQHELPQTLKRL